MTLTRLTRRRAPGARAGFAGAGMAGLRGPAGASRSACPARSPRLCAAGGTGAASGPGRTRGIAESTESTESTEPPQPPRSRNDAERLYDRGQRALDEGRWDEAAMYFSRLAETGGPRTDAALYWTAYAQNRLGQRAEALQTIAALLKSHANSRYTAQARALEVEVRRDAGQPVRPEAQNDEELKLFALQALQRVDPERAFPMLDTILRGTATPRLKTRALFVLAQSNTPKARQVVTEIARGNLSPELQERAIDYLGGQRDAENRALFSEIYAGGDVDVKRRVLRAFAASGDKDRILAAATSEAAPELRGEAVRLLGALGASTEVAALYQKESDVGVKRQILQAMIAGGDTPHLIELARTEPNPDLRRQAVRNLGRAGGSANRVRARWPSSPPTRAPRSAGPRRKASSSSAIPRRSWGWPARNPTPE